jgi:hypothetical protein
VNHRMQPRWPSSRSLSSRLTIPSTQQMLVDRPTVVVGRRGALPTEALPMAAPAQLPLPLAPKAAAVAGAGRRRQRAAAQETGRGR